MKKQSISQSRKFKYGSVAVLFTAAVIAAIVVLNVVATALTQKLSLYVDMTRKIKHIAYMPTILIGF